MSKFYIQSGYQGKEVSSIIFSYPRESLSYSKIEEWRGQPIIGSVEFVEQHIGARVPQYFPKFLQDYLKRKVWISGSWPTEKCFIKPADFHKRFEAQILTDLRYPRGFGGGEARGLYAPPYWCSEVVSFTEEWRYYVANGKVLAAYWYQGKEEEVDAPNLDIEWPKDFCGAVDFGRLSNGEVALVENNLPYACGWYGSMTDGVIYGQWLQEGFSYIKNEDKNKK